MTTRLAPFRGAVLRGFVAVLVAVVGVLLGATAVTAGPAPRHTSLRSVTPADGAVLTTPPAEIVLVFDQPVAQQFTQVVVTRSGMSISLGETSVSSGTVRTVVPGGLAAGSYRIAFRVVSTDGHPVTGESTFQIVGASPSTPTGAGPTTDGATAVTGAPSATTTPGAAGGSGATVAPGQGQAPTGDANHTPGYVVSGLLLLCALALLVWERRRRRADFPPERGGV